MKTFDELFLELSAKAAERPEGSGTVRELDAGVHFSPLQATALGVG